LNGIFQKGAISLLNGGLLFFKHLTVVTEGLWGNMGEMWKLFGARVPYLPLLILLMQVTSHNISRFSKIFCARWNWGVAGVPFTPVKFLHNQEKEHCFCSKF
jgi:hypothetical protein